jgi:hypothetical protein
VLSRNGQPSSARAGGRRTRVVDLLAIHGQPIAFGELCRRAVPDETRYLVLDLDRTVHLGRNMGELLGWELCASHGYGFERLAAAEARRGPGRFFFDPSRPAAVLRYLAVTARMWSAPGVFYLLFGKLPAYLEITRRWAFRTFGPEPVSAVQRVPQTVLLHHLAAVPSATLRVLAQRVWDRYSGDQVIERQDLEELRARCPGIRIVMCSASPKPSLEVAAEALGLDDVLYSAVEEHAGHLSSPYQLNRLFLLGEPRWISGPRQLHINSGRAKIAALLARHPALADPAVPSVGMSDTGYGEDHCWAEHFTRVVDVNSATPFPPIVLAGSPLREIHSAEVLTRSERARRAAGEPGYLDPRRATHRSPDVVYARAELEERLGPIVGEVERLTASLEDGRSDLAAARRLLLDELEGVEGRLDAVAAAFNAASRHERRAALRALRRELRDERSCRRRLARLERPLSEIACTLARLLAESRAALASGRAA